MKQFQSLRPCSCRWCEIFSNNSECDVTYVYSRIFSKPPESTGFNRVRIRQRLPVLETAPIFKAFLMLVVGRGVIALRLFTPYSKKTTQPYAPLRNLKHRYALLRPLAHILTHPHATLRNFTYLILWKFCDFYKSSALFVSSQASSSQRDR